MPFISFLLCFCRVFAKLHGKLLFTNAHALITVKSSRYMYRPTFLILNKGLNPINQW